MRSGHFRNWHKTDVDLAIINVRSWGAIQTSEQLSIETDSMKAIVAAWRDSRPAAQRWPPRSRGKADLRKVLTELCPDGKFSESDTNEIYLTVGCIIGQWSAEENRLDIAPLAKTFR